MKLYDDLTEELTDIQIETVEAVDELIKAKWDSNTLKSKIQKLSKQRNHVLDELDKIFDKIPLKAGPNLYKETRETSP